MRRILFLKRLVTRRSIMDGIEIFSTLSNNDATKSDALLVGKNLCNQQPSNERVFVGYFDFLCKLASNSTTTNERKFYAKEADIALAYFSENVKITKSTLWQIKECKTQLERIVNDIIGMEDAIAQNALKDIQNHNAALLDNLINLKGELSLTTSKEKFDSILHSVQECENSIEKKYLSREQNKLYDALTADYSSVVNEKMTELERTQNVEYNKEAVASFKSAFVSFQSAEKIYRDNQPKLDELVSSYLFCYDATRLFNETLIYYNHVFSYIFNKLDDNGKYRVTELSIDCEKLRRRGV